MNTPYVTDTTDITDRTDADPVALAEKSAVTGSVAAPHAFPESLTFSHALGGSWLNRPLIWMIGCAPSVALGTILEVSLLDETWSRVVAMAFLQFAVALLVLSASTELARRRNVIVAVPLAFLLLALTATAQAVVGGFVAATVTGGSFDFGFRLAFWLPVQLLWSPLVINTLAQFEHRRYLLAELAMHLQWWNVNVAGGVAALRNQHVRLLEMIRTTVSPVIDDIRSRLSGDNAPKKQAEFLSTADQLIVLSTSVKTMLGTPHITASLPLRIPEHPKAFAPLADAISYEIRRPYASSAALAILLLPILAPGMFRLGGLPAIIELTIGVSCSAFLFASGLQLIKLFSPVGTRAAMVYLSCVHVIASIAAPLVVGAMSWEPLSGRSWVVMALLPIGLTFAAVIMSGAFGLGEANRLLVNEMTDIRSRFRRFQDFVGDEERRLNNELEALMHGPIRGRLSACIMALKFHAEELSDVHSTRGETILKAVTRHLDATARDLNRMNVPTPLGVRAYPDGVTNHV